MVIQGAKAPGQNPAYRLSAQFRQRPPDGVLAMQVFRARIIGRVFRLPKGITMSFVKTLATLAAGFAVARGYDRFRKVGGMSGVEDRLRNAGSEGGIGQQLGEMAEKIGLPGGSRAVQDLFASWGPKAADASAAAEASLGGLFSTMQSAWVEGSGRLGEAISSIASGTPAGAMAEQNARLMIRTMIEAAKADGQIDPAERAQIMEALSDAGDEERRFVADLIDAPADMAGLVAAAGDATRAQVYATARMIIAGANGAEKDWLDRLAAGLRLDPATRSALDAAAPGGATA